MKLVREHINEKFVEDSDPIKDMNIGYSNYKEYVSKHFKDKSTEQNFWKWWRVQLRSENNYEDLIDLLLEILEYTPIEVQLEWAKDALESYDFYKKDGISSLSS